MILKHFSKTSISLMFSAITHDFEKYTRLYDGCMIFVWAFEGCMGSCMGGWMTVVWLLYDCCMSSWRSSWRSSYMSSCIEVVWAITCAVIWATIWAINASNYTNIHIWAFFIHLQFFFFRESQLFCKAHAHSKDLHVRWLLMPRSSAFGHTLWPTYKRLQIKQQHLQEGA